MQLSTLHVPQAHSISEGIMSHNTIGNPHISHVVHNKN